MRTPTPAAFLVVSLIAACQTAPQGQDGTGTQEDDTGTQEDDTGTQEEAAYDPTGDASYEDGQGSGSGDSLDWGTEVGSFQGVVAYSNGHTHDVPGSADDYYLEFGWQYQCVEYVNRFLTEALGHRNLRGSGNANDYWGADLGLDQYANNDTCPQAGDVLVSTAGDYGHVAIVSDVDEDAVTVIQQNWSNNSSDGAYRLSMDRAGADCYVHPFGDGSYTIAGWLRVPGADLSDEPDDCVYGSLREVSVDGDELTVTATVYADEGLARWSLVVGETTVESEDFEDDRTVDAFTVSIDLGAEGVEDGEHTLALWAKDMDDCTTGEPIDTTTITVDTSSSTDGLEEWEDDAGLNMITISAGSFTMGSPDDEVGHQDPYEDLHGLVLTHDFRLGVYEVTQGQFDEYMGYNPSYFASCGDDCPVEFVTWHMAAMYANAVSDAAGVEQCYDCDSSSTCEPAMSPYDCEGFRLPTEAEWEYAARAGESSAFPNGGNLTGDDQLWTCDGSLVLDNGEELDDVAWYCGNSSDETHEIGGLDPNNWSLYDVCGNVSEWVHDGYEGSLSSETDPYGDDSSAYKVHRGGSWRLGPWYARLATRVAPDPEHFDYDLGLRLARTIDP